MKIYADDEFLFEVTNSMKDALCSQINRDQLDQTIKENIRWGIQSFCDSSYENLKKEWIPILFHRLKSIPTDREELLMLILSQPDYEDQLFKDLKKQVEKISEFQVT